MKKALTILALSLALVLAVGLVACNDPTGGGSVNGKFDALNTTESVYGFSAASAGMLISSMNGAQPACDVATAADDDDDDDEVDNAPANGAEEVVIDTAQLDQYMALVESLLSDGNFNVLSQTSDRDGFEEKMVVSYQDLSGNTLSYVMYYNQVLTDSETDDEDGEVEEEFSIDGVMVIDEKDYVVHGERKIETEQGESENKTEFVVTLDNNRTLRVKQSLEVEDDETEQKFSYSLYDGETLVESSTFSYESEQGETELKMSTLKDGKTQVVYFEKELKGDKEVIEIHVGKGKTGKGYIVNVNVDENGNKSYTYTETEFDD